MYLYSKNIIDTIFVKHALVRKNANLFNNHKTSYFKQNMKLFMIFTKSFMYVIIYMGVTKTVSGSPFAKMSTF